MAKTVYCCAGCTKTYKYSSDARDCCEPTTKHQCENCEKNYWDYREADKCEKSHRVAQKGYACQLCKKQHDYFDYAVACCKFGGLTGFKCSECDSFHIENVEAVKCCDSPHRKHIHRMNKVLYGVAE